MSVLPLGHAELICRVRDAKDREAADALVRLYGPLSKAMAREAARKYPHLDRDDHASDAAWAVVEAAAHYRDGLGFAALVRRVFSADVLDRERARHYLRQPRFDRVPDSEVAELVVSREPDPAFVAELGDEIRAWGEDAWRSYAGPKAKGKADRPRAKPVPGPPCVDCGTPYGPTGGFGKRRPRRIKGLCMTCYNRGWRRTVAGSADEPRIHGAEADGV